LDDLEGLRDLRRLKAIGVAAPIVFLVAFEACRVLIVDVLLPAPASNIAAAAVGVAAAAAFGLLLFFHIERAQRRMISQNRDMAIVNAVSVAVQGELEIDAAMQAALDRIMAATGATEASITILPLDPDAGPPRVISRTNPNTTIDALAAPDQPVEIGLATGAAPIGRLRLRVPASRVAELPSPEALHTVGHQLGAALEIGRLVADLSRRKDEGHVLYQCLLQISNQAPLPDALGSIVAGARDRLGASDGRICLTSEVLRVFEDDEALTSRLTEGPGCELSTDPASIGEHPERIPIIPAGDHRCELAVRHDDQVMRVPVWIPGELLGDLCLVRQDGAPFSERDRRYLMTLAGIAAIAISAARLRAMERQGAILAERDRIARELHDSLAQVLGSTHLRLRTILAKPAFVEAQPRVAAELAAIADVCEEAYRDVREAILGLREASRGRGLLEALQAYLDKFAQQSGIPVDLEATTDGEPALATSSEIQVIRVIQEALTNVRKHARASRAHIRVTDAQGGEGLMIVVEDDGRGFEPTPSRAHRDGGYGLQTMRERMELAGGSLHIDSGPGRGTRVIAIVPQAARVRAAVGGNRSN
jgi:signal transduction histidine kinase